MDYPRNCGFFYKLCCLCIFLMVVFQYVTQWTALKDRVVVRAQYSEYFRPPQSVMNVSLENNIKYMVDKVDSLIDHLNDDRANSFIEDYADYELETVDDNKYHSSVNVDLAGIHSVNIDLGDTSEDVDALSESKYSNSTLMVLFTSWGYSKEKLAVHETLLRLWSSWLITSVRPLVLTNDINVTNMALASNWSVLPVTKAMRVCKGPPVLLNLFLDTMREYEALFYGYANADIIFGNGLVQTLKFLRNKYQWSDSPVLIVGRRYNYDFKKSHLRLNDSSEVRSLLKYGNLVIRSTDYFFTNKNFPWRQVPMVSIGRPFVVRTVIAFAIKHRYDIIDATRTIESVHLTTADGNLASWHKPGVDCNKHLLLKGHHKLPLGVGHCECASLETIRDKKGSIRLKSRRPSASLCYGLK